MQFWFAMGNMTGTTIEADCAYSSGDLEITHSFYGCYGVDIFFMKYEFWHNVWYLAPIIIVDFLDQEISSNDK